MARACMKFLLVALALLAHAVTTFAQERDTVAGLVRDADGKPLANAVVVVFQARTRFGNVSCATCSADCGKWALTGPDGKYSISGLDPGMVFDLLVGKEGYFDGFIPKVEPGVGADAFKLRPRPLPKSDSQILRGVVVDSNGNPVKDALVQTWAGAISGPGGRVTMYLGGLADQVILTNEKGEFELAAERPFLEATIEVTARGKAPKYFTIAPGVDRKTLTIDGGATIRGRLVYDGKPVAAELRLFALDSAFGRTFPDFRARSAEDGSFVISNVPPGRVWLLGPTMNSLAARGIGSDPRVCQVRSDGEVINLGDVTLKPAHALAGKVVLVDGKVLTDGKTPADGKAIPGTLQVAIIAPGSRDAQIVSIDSDGDFHVRGLPNGIYAVAPIVKGYRLVDHCVTCLSVDVVVDGDVSNLVLRMEPDPGAVATTEPSIKVQR